MLSDFRAFGEHFHLLNPQVFRFTTSFITIRIAALYFSSLLSGLILIVLQNTTKKITSYTALPVFDLYTLKVALPE